MSQFITLTIFIFGASIGSFLNVLIDRLPKEESINGRSHCDFCGKKIVWYDLFPIISFFILGGKTRCCGKKLSFQYLLIEFITGLVFVVVIKDGPYLGSNLIGSVLISGIMACLIVIFVSDLKYHLISDYLLLAFFGFSVLFNLIQFVGSGNPTPTMGLINQTPTISLFLYFFISTLIMAFPIWLIYYISKERAMGLGDVCLTAIMGFLLGWQKGFLALYIAFVTGAIYGLFVMIIKNKKLKSKIAFGPFLVIGTTVMLFWGEKILEMVKRIYGF